MNEWIENLQPVAQDLLVNIIAAIVIFIIGRFIAGVARSLVVKVMKARNVDVILQGFVGNLVYVAILVFAVIAAISRLGIETTSFVAIIGAAGLAIGLALQGSLANFAAGVLMLIFRPFKAGDFVEAGGVTGVVENIQIFTSQFKTGDNKTIIIPNGQIMSGTITNYSTKPTRRVDMTFGVSYDDNIDTVRKTLLDVLSKEDRIINDPAAPFIAVGELGDSSVNFIVRVWVNSADYWGVFFDTTEAVKKRFDEEGISFPFPQQDVHMHTVK